MPTLHCYDSAATTPRAVATRAAALHRDGKFAEAEALLGEAIAVHPNDFGLRHMRGVMLAALKRHREAIWSYRAALALDPTAPGTWTNLGNALTQLDHHASAVACHRNAILVYAWFELPHVSEKFWEQHPEWREKTALGQDAQVRRGRTRRAHHRRPL